ncbi:MAG TPA: hypothetical protein VGM56_00685 [Byssovorax sp.]|jgi:hypothetical protein
MSDERKDVSAAVMRRIRLHLLTTRFMGVGVFCFIAGSIASRPGSPRSALGAHLVQAGGYLFMGALVYGLISTLFILRCPACRRSLGMVLSSLYAPIGPPDDWAPTCSGCGANLLPPNERVRAKAGFLRMIVAMFLLFPAAAAAGFALLKL